MKTAFLPLLASTALLSFTMIPAAGAEGVMVDRLHGLAENPAMQVHGHRIMTRDIIQPFYEQRGWTRAWTDARQVDDLLELLEAAPDHGMDPADFMVDTLRSLVNDPGAAGSDLDLLLTEALLRYAYNRAFGKVNPETIDPDINYDRQLRRDAPPHVTLAEVLAGRSLPDQLAELVTEGPWYRILQKELAALRDLGEAGGWPRIGDGGTLRAGDQEGRVIELRQRLSRQPGLTLEPTADPSRFDESLEQTVRRFQQLHGLDVDGAVGPATLRALNVPLEARSNQLRLALERLRWIRGEADSNDTFVAVNIAGFRVYLVEDGDISWTTRGIIGTPYRKTPLFRGDMSYIEFNPTWTVPPSIHRKDVLPAIKKDPAYLANKHMEVLTRDGQRVDPATVDWSSLGSTAPYIFRQTPGPWNALGQVKFIFPNSHFVFLHDTPNRNLFNRSERAFSSGCIRVEDPMTLAERILAREGDWNRERIDATVASGQTTRANVQQKMPVLLLYLTAAPGNDGQVSYLDDVYDRDPPLLAALESPISVDLPAARAN
jgi:murein L,D-transpeptidase YcbB/YkuD